MLNRFIRTKSFLLNFGPQHPAAHGVLRLILHLKGELVLYIEPHIGLLHRATEKLIEYKGYLQGLPYMDRLDYVSMMVQEQAYSLVIESLLGLKVPYKAQCIRVLFCELTRILNHLLALTTHALDVGAITPFLWGFEEREKIMEFYERVSGARMHAAYIRPGGVSSDISEDLLNDIYWFTKQFTYRIDEIDALLSLNPVWCMRLKHIGYINTNEALQLGLSGVLLRGSGLNWDLRRDSSYEMYNDVAFFIPTGKNGDCYDRFLIRIAEMKESLRIILQVLILLKKCLNGDMVNVLKIKRSILKFDMHSLIQHFKKYTQSLVMMVKDAHGYMCVEAPKGEFGIFFSFLNYKINRLRIRAPGFMHIQNLNYLTRMHFLADLVTIIGTLDLVFGEIDR